ncbi:MAG TPA: SPFH domain-containing protein, partial [Candidatus Binatia bacterium]|nr:SPFH domain-containing protein [Candidatus Binatia bacterium]
MVIGGFILFSLVWGSLIGPIRGFEGAIVAGLVAFGFFLGIVLLAGPHVLPIDPNSREQVSRARKTLLRFAMGLPTLMAVVRDGNVMPGPDGRSRENASGQGVIDVDSTSVVILATDTKLSRIEGPGVIFTNKDEHIRQVVDLRIQNRKEEVDLVTRDGIQVRVSVSVRFQIDKVEPVRVQDEQPATRWPMPYRWTQRTVSRALEQQRVGPNGPVLWDFIVLDIAVA